MADEIKKSETFSIRLDPLTRDKLEYISDIEYRSLNLQIRKIIEDFVRKYEIEFLLDEYGNKLEQHMDYPMIYGEKYPPF